MMGTIAERHVGYLAHAHFAIAEVPLGVMLELDRGVPVIVLGSQEGDGGEHLDALCQVIYEGEPAAIYVPWDKITLTGKRSFELLDGTGGLPFPSVR